MVLSAAVPVEGSPMLLDFDPVPLVGVSCLLLLPRASPKVLAGAPCWGTNQSSQFASQ